MRAHILLVDDEQLVLNATARMLRVKFDVDCARTWEQAVQLIDQVQYDAVITDVMMPGVDGLDLYYRIIAERPELERAFIFVSGSIEPCFGRAWPADAAMLLKPVSRSELIACIEGVIVERRTVRPRG